MKIPVFLANRIDTSYPDTLPSDDRQLPISAIYGKVLDCDGHDEPVFMNHYDPRSPATVAECVEMADRYRAQGIEFYPWGVSRGINPTAEGDIAGIVAHELGVPYILDLEDGELYWRGDATAVREWVRAYSHHASELWISCDARAGHPGIHLDEWVSAAIVTRWMPQAYWTDFQQDWKTGIERAYQPLQEALMRVVGFTEEAACRRIYPTFPGYATTEDMDAAIAWSQGLPPFGGISLWMRGNTSIEMYSAIATWPDYRGPFSQPQPPAPVENPLAVFGSRQLLEELLRRTP